MRWKRTKSITVPDAYVWTLETAEGKYIVQRVTLANHAQGFGFQTTYWTPDGKLCRASNATEAMAECERHHRKMRRERRAAKLENE